MHLRFQKNYVVWANQSNESMKMQMYDVKRTLKRVWQRAIKTKSSFDLFGDRSSQNLVFLEIVAESEWKTYLEWKKAFSKKLASS